MSRSLRVERALLAYGFRALAAGTAATTATLHYISCRPTDVDGGNTSSSSTAAATTDPSPSPSPPATAAVPPGSSVAVVGGGLVGLLQARALAQEGYTVTLFEQAPSVVPEEPAPDRPWVPHPSPVLLTTPGGDDGDDDSDPTPLLRHGDLPHASALPWVSAAASVGYPAFSWGGLLSQPRRRGDLLMLHNTACLVGTGGRALPHQRRGLGGGLACVARMRAEAPGALASLLAELPPGAAAAVASVSPPLRRTAVVRGGRRWSPEEGGGGAWLAPREAEEAVDGFLASWSFAAARVLAGGGPAAGDAAAAYAVPRVPLARALREEAVAGGVRMCEGAEVVRVEEVAAEGVEEGGKRCRVRLAGGGVADADAVVLCCGAAARRLNKGRLHLPVVNVQRRTVTQPASTFDDLPKAGSVLWDVDTAVSLMHSEDGLVTVRGLYEVCDRDRTPSDRSQRSFRDYLRHTVDPKDGEVCLPVVENLAVTPDYAPLVGSAGGGSAVFVNTGHGEHGLAGALATAGELAAAMRDPRLFGSSEILQRLLPSRFSLLW